MQGQEGTLRRLSTADTETERDRPAPSPRGAAAPSPAARRGAPAAASGGGVAASSEALLLKHKADEVKKLKQELASKEAQVGTHHAWRPVFSSLCL